MSTCTAAAATTRNPQQIIIAVVWSSQFEGTEPRCSELGTRRTYLIGPCVTLKLIRSLKLPHMLLVHDMDTCNAEAQRRLVGYVKRVWKLSPREPVLYTVDANWTLYDGQYALSMLITSTGPAKRQRREALATNR